MTPRSYLRKYGREHVTQLCERVGTKWSYFKQVVYGKDQFSGRLARLFHEATDGELNMYEHRSDIFGNGKPKRKRAEARA